MNRVMFKPQSATLEVVTDDIKTIEVLMDNFEARIIDAAKKGNFESARDLINFYLELEKGKDLLERGSVNGDCKFTF